MEVEYHEMVTMMKAFSTISRLIELVHYDEDIHKQRAMEMKRKYEDLANTFSNAIEYVYEGDMESYILPSIATEIFVLKKYIHKHSEDGEDTKA